MTDDLKTKRGTRPRSERIEVWLTPSERAAIAYRATVSGMALSAYMRAAGLNHPITSVYDLRAVADLSRINGDLGRVAGLLKRWLAERRGQGARPLDVEVMMDDFRSLQGTLSAAIRRVVQ